MRHDATLHDSWNVASCRRGVVASCNHQYGTQAAMRSGPPLPPRIFMGSATR
jgi:hypothetical protein